MSIAKRKNNSPFPASRPQSAPRSTGRGENHANPPPPGSVRLYGRHPVVAALANPARRLLKLWVTPEALTTLTLPPGLPVQTVPAMVLAAMTAPTTPHQGMVLDARPLDELALEDILDANAQIRAPLLLLDQVTDPHNVGAILRSAAAFGAAAVITQDRHSPPETGALAKAASGCLELVPWVRVVNLSRALETIADAGYWRLGLAGEAPSLLETALPDQPLCLALGAEGAGLRPNVAAHCDALARLSIAPTVESLNVSNAAAVALYAVRRLGA